LGGAIHANGLSVESVCENRATVAGNAWSREIDLSGQFTRTARWPIYLVGALALAGAALRLRARSPSRRLFL
jgi:hypothetical protein